MGSGEKVRKTHFWTDVLAFHIQLVGLDMWTWVNHIPSIFRVIYLSNGPPNAPHKMYNGRGHAEGITLVVSCCLWSSYIALKVWSGCVGAWGLFFSQIAVRQALVEVLRRREDTATVMQAVARLQPLTVAAARKVYVRVSAYGFASAWLTRTTAYRGAHY